MARRPTNSDSTRPGDAGGATMATEYLGQNQQLTLVDVEDLRDWKTAMREESWQFSIAGFFASGALWLGVERLSTEGAGDGLFQFCVIVLIASAIVGYFGYRQLGRRSIKIQRYIEKAEANAEVTAQSSRPSRAVTEG